MKKIIIISILLFTITSINTNTKTNNKIEYTKAPSSTIMEDQNTENKSKIEEEISPISVEKDFLEEDFEDDQEPSSAEIFKNSFAKGIRFGEKEEGKSQMQTAAEFFILGIGLVVVSFFSVFFH